MVQLDHRVILGGKDFDAVGQLDRAASAAAKANANRDKNALRMQQNMANLMPGMGGNALRGGSGGGGGRSGGGGGGGSVGSPQDLQSQQARQLGMTWLNLIRDGNIEQANALGAQYGVPPVEGINDPTVAQVLTQVEGFADYMEEQERMQGLISGPQPEYEMMEGPDGRQYYVDPSNPNVAPVPVEGMGAPQPEVPSGAQTLAWRAQEAGLEPGTAAYQEFMRRGGQIPEGMSLRSTPDGGFEFVQGEGVQGGAADLTELQSKNAVFATRAEGALQTLDEVVDEDSGTTRADVLTSRRDRVLDMAPMGVGRELQDSEYQLAQAAGQEFLQAILRKDTGAAITDQEQILYGQLYLPQPGDTPEVLQYRREARQRAVDAIKAGMSQGALLNMTNALRQGLPETGQGGEQPAPGQNIAPPQGGAGQPTQTFIDALGGEGDANAVWQNMTPEERALFPDG